jgi:hypothetical protein
MKEKPFNCDEMKYAVQSDYFFQSQEKRLNMTPAGVKYE